ncbi:MAG: hypothetical protein ACOCWO_03645 [Candidatus Muiribacteriaceae bacterium]
MKIIIIMLMIIVFSFHISAVNMNVIEKNLESNRDAYYDVLEGLPQLIHKIITSQDSDARMFSRMIIKEKIRFLRYLDNYYDVLERKPYIQGGNNAIALDVKCKRCNGKGCPACNYDGYAWGDQDSEEELKECGRCNGSGSFAGDSGGICKGCDGTGYANLLPDPPRWFKITK